MVIRERLSPRPVPAPPPPAVTEHLPGPPWAQAPSLRVGGFQRENQTQAGSEGERRPQRGLVPTVSTPSARCPRYRSTPPQARRHSFLCWHVSPCSLQPPGHPSFLIPGPSTDASPRRPEV